MPHPDPAGGQCWRMMHNVRCLKAGSLARNFREYFKRINASRRSGANVAHSTLIYRDMTSNAPRPWTSAR
jgi:hypothetical protein